MEVSSLEGHDVDPIVWTDDEPMETELPRATSKRRRLEVRRVQEAPHGTFRDMSLQPLRETIRLVPTFRVNGEDVNSDGAVAARCHAAVRKTVDEDESTHPSGKTTLQPPRSTNLPADRLDLFHWSSADLLSTVTYLVNSRIRTHGSTRHRVTTKRSIGGQAEPGRESDEETAENHGPVGWRSRGRGRDFYWWVMATLTGRKRCEVVQLTTLKWKAAPRATRDSWGRFADRVKRKGLESHVIALQGARSPNTLSSKMESCCKPADELAVSGFGVLLVFPVQVSSTNLQALRFLKGAPLHSSWSRTLAELPYFRRLIDECWTHVQCVGARHGLPLIACSLEHDDSETRDTSLHLSVYMGREVRGGKISSTSAKTSILRADLQWGAVAPVCVRPTRAKDGQTEAMNVAIIREYYRVARAKKTQVLCRTSAALYKDVETARTESSVTVIKFSCHV